MDSYAQIVADAMRDWLSDQGRVAQYLPLQQLFALCHAGLLPCKTAQPAPQPPRSSSGALNSSGPLRPSSPELVLGGGLVRLLDGCLTAAAALPHPDLRRHAASNVIAAFCHSALREARSRVSSSRSSGQAPPTPSAGDANPAGGASAFAGATAAEALDAEFLDAAFAVLAAVAPRHLLLFSELRVMEVAWGTEQAEPAAAAAENPHADVAVYASGAAAAVAPPAKAAAGLPWTASTAAGQALYAQGDGGSGPTAPGSAGCLAAGAGPCVLPVPTGRLTLAPNQSEPDAESLAGFFLSSEFQCHLAAGQLLYGAARYGGPAGVSGGGIGLSGGCPVAAVRRDDGTAPYVRGRNGGNYGCHSGAGVYEAADPMDWARDDHPYRRLCAAAGGGVEFAKNGDEAGIEAEAEKQRQQQRQPCKFQQWEEEALEGLCEMPAMAELCGAAAVADVWPDLVWLVAEGGAEAAVRWLMDGRCSCLNVEGEEREGKVCDGVEVPRALGPMGVEGGSHAVDGIGMEAAEAEAVQRLVSRRCCRLLAEALTLAPAVMLPVIPPQLLCVLALRSRAVRAAMLEGLAGLLLSGEGSCPNPFSPPPPLLMSDGPQREYVRGLAAWFRVLGWDLGEMMQRHLL